MPAGVGVDEYGVVRLEPPVEARRLAELWRVARPLAVSGDVSQRSWWLVGRGDDLPSEYGARGLLQK